MTTHTHMAPPIAKARLPKVTYRQEGGDDGYSYVLRVDGRSTLSGMTRASCIAEKKRILMLAQRKAELASTLNPSPELLRAIYAVWQQIGYDCEAACEGDNECAVEQCIDADRLHPSMSFVHDEGAAHRELRTLINTHGYGTVLKALSRALRLV